MRNVALAAAVECWLLGAWLCALLVDGAAAQGQRKAQLEVVTKFGPLHGKLARVEGVQQPVSVFLGIPFARPPVGALRFSPPQPAEPWSHMRDSTAHPPMCLQDLAWVDMFRKMWNANVPNLTVSEDCLYLNVFTPDTKAKLPVMVWIHGGALVLGGASIYDGSALSAYGQVVVVVLQYRLGLAGFFSTGSEEARGNWGLLDQVAALQWVQENIEHFGGDPHSVTIFGESAGGFSVGAQERDLGVLVDRSMKASTQCAAAVKKANSMLGIIKKGIENKTANIIMLMPLYKSMILSPLSKGLFHGAISESGVAQIPGLIISDPEVITRKVANASGCGESGGSSAALVRCLRSQPEERLRALNAQLVQDIGGAFPAVIDGEFLPKAPEELLAAKEFNAVPYLLGVNNHEYGWVVPAATNVDITNGMDRQTCTAVFQQTTLMRFPPEVAQSLVDEYLGDAEDPVQLRGSFQDLMGDALFVVPALQIARFHRDSGAPVYFYEFQHRPTAFEDTKPAFVKADHGDEIAFVFGWPFLRADSAMLGDSTEEERQLSRVVMMYWANFARSGNPNGKGLVEWPRYGQSEEYLELNLEQRKGQQLRRQQVDLWLKTLPGKRPLLPGAHAEL